MALRKDGQIVNRRAWFDLKKIGIWQGQVTYSRNVIGKCCHRRGHRFSSIQFSSQFSTFNVMLNLLPFLAEDTYDAMSKTGATACGNT